MAVWTSSTGQWRRSWRRIPSAGRSRLPARSAGGAQPTRRDPTVHFLIGKLEIDDAVNVVALEEELGLSCTPQCISRPAGWTTGYDAFTRQTMNAPLTGQSDSSGPPNEGLPLEPGGRPPLTVCHDPPQVARPAGRVAESFAAGAHPGITGHHGRGSLLGSCAGVRAQQGAADERVRPTIGCVVPRCRAGRRACRGGWRWWRGARVTEVATRALASRSSAGP